MARKKGPGGPKRTSRINNDTRPPWPKNKCPNRDHWEWHGDHWHHIEEAQVPGLR